MKQNKQSLVENSSLDDEILKAKRSEGYLFCISRLNAGKLTHSWFTQKFSKEDIPATLTHYIQSLKREMPSTVHNKLVIDEKERKLPPEYRLNKDERSASN